MAASFDAGVGVGGGVIGGEGSHGLVGVGEGAVAGGGAGFSVGVKVGDGVGVSGAVVSEFTASEVEDVVHLAVGFEAGLVDGEEDGAAFVRESA